MQSPKKMRPWLGFLILAGGLAAVTLVIMAMSAQTQAVDLVTAVAQEPKRILIPTWTSTPTSAPISTQTPTPTQTPAPTQTPTPTVTPLPEPVLIEYDELARYTESNIGSYILMRGKVVQVIEHGDELYTLLINVTYDGYTWEDTVMLVCLCTFRPLDGDVVGFSAIVAGRYTYETVLGASVTVPNLTAVAFTLLD